MLPIIFVINERSLLYWLALTKSTFPSTLVNAVTERGLPPRLGDDELGMEQTQRDERENFFIIFQKLSI